MGIILAIIGVLVLLMLVGLALMAISIWLLIWATFFVFVLGGLITESIFQSGQDAFYLGGAGAVFLLWIVLVYIANCKERNSSWFAQKRANH